jgi:hypothetical protein
LGSSKNSSNLYNPLTLSATSKRLVIDDIVIENVVGIVDTGIIASYNSDLQRVDKDMYVCEA